MDTGGYPVEVSGAPEDDESTVPAGLPGSVQKAVIRIRIQALTEDGGRMSEGGVIKYYAGARRGPGKRLSGLGHLGPRRLAARRLVNHLECNSV
jgi:hypothetical protein